MPSMPDVMPSTPAVSPSASLSSLATAPAVGMSAGNLDADTAGCAKGFPKGYPKDSVAWLKRLIGFDTVSSHSNLALIEDVQCYCQQLGVAVRLTFNDDKSKANLLATVVNHTEVADGMLDGADSSCSGGIVLSGHTDVVPVLGQDWTSNPFVADVRDGRVYGRGTCDMKGFIACCLAMLPTAVAMAEQGKLPRAVHLALSFDEEVGCLGVPLLLADMAAQGIHPAYCIVGEPSNMSMVVAHKGISVYRCRVHGKSVHSSLTPKGVNAISYAARLVSHIDALAQTLAGRNDCDELFDVPFSSLSVGTIQGGTATNIVPNLCEFTFDYRNLPHMGQADILPAIEAKIAELSDEMHAIDANTGIDIEQLEDVPAMTDADSEQLQVMIAALVDDAQRHKVAYATEGGQFTRAGIPTLICGPGSIEQAHKADEYVSLEQLARCDAFLQKLLQL